MRQKLFQWGVIGAAAAVFGFITHWVGQRPPTGGPREFPLPIFVRMATDGGAGDTLITPVYVALSISLTFIAAGAASALALFIIFRAPPAAATRRLAAALALGALAAVFFYVVSTHGAYRSLVSLDGPWAWRFALHAGGYGAALFAVFLLVRFFLGYPRTATEADWERHVLRLEEEARERVATGWRRHFYRGRTSRRTASSVPFQMMVFRTLHSRWPVPLLLAIAALIGAVDASATVERTPALRLAQFFSTVLLGGAVVLLMTQGVEALKLHHRNAVGEDRQRIDWIYGTLMVGGIVLGVLPPLWWATLLVIIPWVEALGIVAPGAILFAGPIHLALQLYVLAFLAALALSIFYRGTVDPRLGIGRVTLFGALGVLVAFLFVLVERAVALQAVQWLGWPPETGAVLAGALVAATVAPLKGRVELLLNVLVTRFLPLDALVQGERKAQSIVLSDLTGYTALSARDERQAMLVAALLQRKAQSLMAVHGGRLVKSMGDAVLLAFDDAAAAARVLAALHREFGPAAIAVGVEPLEVHSGAHFGDVTQTADGDVFGQTVNIAARLQGTAAPGQAVISAAFAAQAGLQAPSLRSLGPKSLKNVPDPVECLSLEPAT